MKMQESRPDYEEHAVDASTLSDALSILLPVHNEAATIESVLSDFCATVAGPLRAETIVCEDGSTDGTAEVLRDLAQRYPIRLLTGSRRKGYASAVRDGLRNAHSNLVFFADSDGQYAAEDFWRLWPHIDDYDMIVGRKERRADPLHRTVLSKGFHLLTKTLFQIPLKDLDCGFRIIRRNVIDKVLPRVRSLPYSFWAEFTIVASHQGFRILEVPITHKKRLQGITSIYTYEQLPFIVMKQAAGLANLSLRLKGR